MKDYDIPKQVCLRHKMDVTTDAPGNTAREGDVSMYLGWGATSLFTKDLEMRKPTTGSRIKSLGTRK
jgi:hypothetical protein